MRWGPDCSAGDSLGGKWEVMGTIVPSRRCTVADRGLPSLMWTAASARGGHPQQRRGGDHTVRVGGLRTAPDRGTQGENRAIDMRTAPTGWQAFTCSNLPPIA